MFFLCVTLCFPLCPFVLKGFNFNHKGTLRTSLRNTKALKGHKDRYSLLKMFIIGNIKSLSINCRICFRENRSGFINEWRNVFIPG